MMKTSRIIQIIKKTIRENNLISLGDGVLVALSGGADSVFLIHALAELSDELGFTISACHVEHGIRGKDAMEDMVFSRELCNRMGIEFFSESFDVPALATKEKISVEAAGRKVRYNYFSELMSEHGFAKLATAHHRDDKTETVLMNILRGCGLHGFSGIEYKNNNIIRPLLDITKEEILLYLKENNIPYRTDKTNDDTVYTRNRVRLSLIPELRSYNPSFDENLLKQSKIFTAEDDYMASAASDSLNSCRAKGGIDVKKLTKLHIALQRRVMYMYLSECKGTPLDISYTDVEAALTLCRSGETGKRCKLAGSITYGVDYGIFSVVEEIAIPEFEYNLKFGEPVLIKELGIKITLKPTGGKLLVRDGDRVTVRNRRNGDYFCPIGMTGRKKLKDYFTDKKVPRDSRSKIPVLTVNGEVASLVGLRDDRRFYDCGGTCKVVTETI